MKHSFLLLLSLIAAQAQAQIIYTDVVPDQVCDTSGAHYALDLDNDDTMDFDIQYYKDPLPACPGGGCAGGFPQHSSWVKTFPENANAVDSTAVGYAGMHGALALPPLSVIGAGPAWSIFQEQVLAKLYTWCAGGGFPVCTHTTYGPWSDGVSVDTARYVGLRFDIGGATHYGWARLSVPFAANIVPSFTLKDYAYNTVPDEFILAGDTGSVISTGVAEFAQRSVVVSPNPFTNTLSVHLGARKPGDVSCNLRALTGEVIETLTIHATRSAFTLDLAALAPGTYLLEVMIDGVRIVRKVMKE